VRVEERSEFGSRTSRRLRRAGLVPGVVYGGGSEAQAFQVPERDARAVLTRGGALLDVQFDGGNATPVVVKEQQRDPVRGSLLHLDLLEVKLDEEIQAEVPIELLGTEDAPGVKEGGVLEHVTHQITIEALPRARSGPRARRPPRAPTPKRGSNPCDSSAGAAGTGRPAASPESRQAPTACWSSDSATRSAATRRRGTTSASRSRPSCRAAGSC